MVFRPSFTVARSLLVPVLNTQLHDTPHLLLGPPRIALRHANVAVRGRMAYVFQIGAGIGCLADRTRTGIHVAHRSRDSGGGRNLAPTPLEALRGIGAA